MVNEMKCERACYFCKYGIAGSCFEDQLRLLERLNKKEREMMI